MRTSILRHTVLAILMVAGLLRMAPAPAQEAPPTASGPEALRKALEPLAFPDLSRLEDAVAQELRAGQELLAEELQSPTPSRSRLLDLFGQLGRLYHAHDLREAAAICYRNASRLTPDDHRWLHLLGVLAQEDGRLDDAEGFFNVVTALEPKYLAARVRFGEVLAALGQPEAAARQLDIALKLDPTCAAAMAALGEQALAAQDFAAAVRWFEAALAALPAANRLHYPLALAYRGLGQADKAQEHLEKRGTVGARPPDPLMDEVRQMVAGLELHLLRGRLAFQAGRFEDAAKEFQGAVAARPDSPRGYISLGTTLAQLGRNQEALAQFRKALELAPDDPTVHFNLGSLLAHLGSGEEALAHLEKALAIKPDDAAAHRLLGENLRRLGRLDEALPHLERVRELSPLDAEARLSEGQVLVSLGRYGEALERLEQAHEKLPQHGPLAHALARLLAASPDLSRRNGDRALDLALRVFEADGSLEQGVTVAMALAEAGQCEAAAEWQRIAVKNSLEAGQPELARELGRILPIYEGGPPCRYPAPSGDGSREDRHVP